MAMDSMDLLIGADEADPGDDNGAGESYVVFGKPNGNAVELSTIAAGIGGFVINGIDVYDSSGGECPQERGDVNGDGLDDLIIGANNADPSNVNRAGESYVVFSPGDCWNARGRFGWILGVAGMRMGPYYLPFNLLSEGVGEVASGGDCEYFWEYGWTVILRGPYILNKAMDNWCGWGGGGRLVVRLRVIFGIVC